jgi:thiol-disulfide isomerase/thioredoxin
VIPTALSDQPVPAFDLEPLDASTLGLASTDLRPGEISVINVWASWCVPCRAEHPRLEEIAAAFDGVERVFAIQAGREIRVVVDPGTVDDLAASALSRRIARRLEEDLQYPGQIEVTVIREFRAKDFAR